MTVPRRQDALSQVGLALLPRAQVLGAGHWGFLPPRDTCLSGLGLSVGRHVRHSALGEWGQRSWVSPMSEAASSPAGAPVRDCGWQRSQARACVQTSP